MYTKASIARHPIHSMLVAFPIALYTSTFVALLIHAVTTDPFWYRAAMWANVAGVVMAIVAAVPGLVDLANLPSYSMARTTGLRHAALNGAALILFAASGAIMYGNRTAGHALGDVAPLTLALFGLATTALAGWYGWTLVQTHHVGVAPETYPLSRPQTNRQRHRDDDLLPPPPETYPRTTGQIVIRH
jgi:uncharacterized membrane protein